MLQRPNLNNNVDDASLLVEVAKLYYEEQLTQAQIGRQLQTSRSTVFRCRRKPRRHSN